MVDPLPSKQLAWVQIPLPTEKKKPITQRLEYTLDKRKVNGSSPFGPKVNTYIISWFYILKIVLKKKNKFIV